MVEDSGDGCDEDRAREHSCDYRQDWYIEGSGIDMAKTKLVSNPETVAMAQWPPMEVMYADAENSTRILPWI